jgi:hypothetical protein
MVQRTGSVLIQDALNIESAAVSDPIPGPIDSEVADVDRTGTLHEDLSRNDIGRIIDIGSVLDYSARGRQNHDRILVRVRNPLESKRLVDYNLFVVLARANFNAADDGKK